MAKRVAIIGFGEAAQAFVGGAGWSGDVRAFDKLTDDPTSRAAKLSDYERLAVRGADRIADAVEGAEIVLSLVTADQAADVARAAAPHLQSGVIYCEMNSVAPETKRSGAAAIEAAGGEFVDVAIMSPVNPAGLETPLLLSGPHALEAERALRTLGFGNLRTIGSRVGEASAVKMIRSVIVKGIEALTAEAMLAAYEAGVVDEVLASLDASEREQSWAARANYNLDRMITHGIRRAEEMDEVVRTLNSLGIVPHLTKQTALRQREIGRLGVRSAATLEEKLAQLRPAKADAA
jgi:3-hydroxyisobutyrate dehydrogenase-like beta-hydroxyacid dehydrogenase